jgi:hypothetical protein
MVLTGAARAEKPMKKMQLKLRRQKKPLQPMQKNLW